MKIKNRNGELKVSAKEIREKQLKEEYKDFKMKKKPTKIKDLVERLEKIEEILGL